jgi:hypothetical protein
MMILAGNARRGPTPGMVGAALVAARAVAGGRPSLWWPPVRSLTF